MTFHAKQHNSLTCPLYQELKHLEDLLNKQWITNSHWEYSSLVVAVRKKDGTLWLCCDYRKLNAETIRDCYPLPRMQDIIDSLSEDQYFSFVGSNKSTLPTAHGPESRKFTAFLTPWLFYEWMYIPFGLMNAPVCFQKFMESCLEEYRDDFAIPYLYNLLVYSESFEDHLTHVRLVLQRLKDMALRLRHLIVSYLKGKFIVRDG